MNIQYLIKEFRKKNSLTQESFGRLLGVNKQTVSKWENNTLQPSIYKMYEIAQVIGIPLEIIINSSNSDESNSFIYEKRTSYTIGLNSVYHAIQDFDSLCIFIDLFSSAHHLLEPSSNIIGYLLVDMTIDDTASHEEAMKITLIHYDDKSIFIHISDYILELSKENIFNIKSIKSFNNETYIINIYMNKKNNSKVFLQLILGFNNDEVNQ